MGFERIRQLFAETRAEDRAAFLPYMTAGLPSPSASPGIFEAMAEAGADAFEVGIPYSDPLMDGPIIQRGSDTALAAGTDLDTALRIAGGVGEATGLPILAMTYANPVFHRGVDRFLENLVSRGIDGVIVPDLPIEEAEPLLVVGKRLGLGVVLFVAPTSAPARIEAVVEANPAFIYAVAEMGVTGERTESGGHIVPLIEKIRSITDIPIVFGVGISGAEQAIAVAKAGADGLIIGSALVRRVLDNPDPESAARAVGALVAEVSKAIRSRPV